MSKTIRYQIHDFLSIRIDAPETAIRTKLIDPLAYFLSGSSCDTADICASIGPFTPNLKGCTKVDHSVFVRHGYVFSSYRTRQLRLEVETSAESGGRIRLRAQLHSKTPRGWLFAFEALKASFLLPLIDVELARRGVATIPACGVVDGRGATVLVGRGGVFKTSLAMGLVREKGMSFLADDRLLLDAQGNCFAFPTFLGLFALRLRYLKDERITPLRKAQALVGYVGSPLKVPVCRTAPVRRIAFLEKGGGTWLRRSLSRAEAVNKISTGTLAERCSSPSIGGLQFPSPLDLPLAAAVADPDNSSPYHAPEIRHIVDKAVVQLPSQFPQVPMPFNYSQDSLAVVLRQLERYG